MKRYPLILNYNFNQIIGYVELSTNDECLIHYDESIVDIAKFKLNPVVVEDTKGNIIAFTVNTHTIIKS